MKQKETRWTALASFVALTFLLSNSIGCGGIVLDRTTTIYGKVIDESRQPVDSIPIIVVAGGIGKHSGSLLTRAYTDKEGNYRIVVEVPKSSAILGIDLNAEETINYKDCLVYLNGERVNDCCSVSAGKKANYDFLLLSR
jgi:hypothetical protein